MPHADRPASGRTRDEATSASSDSSLPAVPPAFSPPPLSFSSSLSTAFFSSFSSSPSSPSLQNAPFQPPDPQESPFLSSPAASFSHPSSSGSSSFYSASSPSSSLSSSVPSSFPSSAFPSSLPPPSLASSFPTSSSPSPPHSELLDGLGTGAVAAVPIRQVPSTRCVSSSGSRHPAGAPSFPPASSTSFSSCVSRASGSSSSSSSRAASDSASSPHPPPRLPSCEQGDPGPRAGSSTRRKRTICEISSVLYFERASGGARSACLTFSAAACSASPVGLPGGNELFRISSRILLPSMSSSSSTPLSGTHDAETRGPAARDSTEQETRTLGGDEGRRAGSVSARLPRPQDGSVEGEAAHAGPRGSDEEAGVGGTRAEESEVAGAAENREDALARLAATPLTVVAVGRQPFVALYDEVTQAAKRHRKSCDELTKNLDLLLDAILESKDKLRAAAAAAARPPSGAGAVAGLRSGPSSLPSPASLPPSFSSLNESVKGETSSFPSPCTAPGGGGASTRGGFLPASAPPSSPRSPPPSSAAPFVLAENAIAGNQSQGRRENDSAGRGPAPSAACATEGQGTTAEALAEARGAGRREGSRTGDRPPADGLPGAADGASPAALDAHLSQQGRLEIQTMGRADEAAEEGGERRDETQGTGESGVLSSATLGTLDAPPHSSAATAASPSALTSLVRGWEGDTTASLASAVSPYGGDGRAGLAGSRGSAASSFSPSCFSGISSPPASPSPALLPFASASPFFSAAPSPAAACRPGNALSSSQSALPSYSLPAPCLQVAPPSASVPPSAVSEASAKASAGATLGAPAGGGGDTPSGGGALTESGASSQLAAFAGLARRGDKGAEGIHAAIVKEVLRGLQARVQALDVTHTLAETYKDQQMALSGVARAIDRLMPGDPAPATRVLPPPPEQQLFFALHARNEKAAAKAAAGTRDTPTAESQALKDREGSSAEAGASEETAGPAPPATPAARPQRGTETRVASRREGEETEVLERRRRRRKESEEGGNADRRRRTVRGGFEGALTETGSGGTPQILLAGLTASGGSRRHRGSRDSEEPSFACRVDEPCGHHVSGRRPSLSLCRSLGKSRNPRHPSRCRAAGRDPASCAYRRAWCTRGSNANLAAALPRLLCGGGWSAGFCARRHLIESEDMLLAKLLALHFLHCGWFDIYAQFCAEQQQIFDAVHCPCLECRGWSHREWLASRCEEEGHLAVSDSSSENSQQRHPGQETEEAPPPSSTTKEDADGRGRAQMGAAQAKASQEDGTKKEAASALPWPAAHECLHLPSGDRAEETLAGASHRAGTGSEEKVEGEAAARGTSRSVVLSSVTSSSPLLHAGDPPGGAARHLNGGAGFTGEEGLSSASERGDSEVSSLPSLLSFGVNESFSLDSLSRVGTSTEAAQRTTGQSRGAPGGSRHPTRPAGTRTGEADLSAKEAEAAKAPHEPNGGQREQGGKKTVQEGLKQREALDWRSRHAEKSAMRVGRLQLLPGEVEAAYVQLHEILRRLERTRDSQLLQWRLKYEGNEGALRACPGGAAKKNGIDLALHWLARQKKHHRRRLAALHFELHKLKFLSLLSSPSSTIEEALLYSRSHLAPLWRFHKADVCRLMGCVAFFGRRSATAKDHGEALAGSSLLTSSSPCLSHHADVKHEAQAQGERSASPERERVPDGRDADRSGSRGSALSSSRPGASEGPGRPSRAWPEASADGSASAFSFAVHRGEDREDGQVQLLLNGRVARGQVSSAFPASHEADGAAEAHARQTTPDPSAERGRDPNSSFLAETTPYRDLVSEAEWARVLNLFRRAFCEVGLLLPVCGHSASSIRSREDVDTPLVAEASSAAGSARAAEVAGSVPVFLGAQASPPGGASMPALALPPPSTAIGGVPFVQASRGVGAGSGGVVGAQAAGNSAARRSSVQALWDAIAGRRQAAEAGSGGGGSPSLRGAGGVVDGTGAAGAGYREEMTLAGAEYGPESSSAEEEAGMMPLHAEDHRVAESSLQTSSRTARSSAESAGDRGRREGRGGLTRARITIFYRPGHSDWRQAEAVTTAAHAGIPVDFLSLLPPEPPRLAPSVSCVGRPLSTLFAGKDRYPEFVDAAVVSALNSASGSAAATAAVAAAGALADEVEHAAEEYSLLSDVPLSAPRVPALQCFSSFHQSILANEEKFYSSSEWYLDVLTNQDDDMEAPVQLAALGTCGFRGQRFTRCADISAGRLRDSCGSGAFCAGRQLLTFGEAAGSVLAQTDGCPVTRLGETRVSVPPGRRGSTSSNSTGSGSAGVVARQAALGATCSRKIFRRLPPISDLQPGWLLRIHALGGRRWVPAGGGAEFGGKADGAGRRTRASDGSYHGSSPRRRGAGGEYRTAEELVEELASRAHESGERRATGASSRSPTGPPPRPPFSIRGGKGDPDSFAAERKGDARARNESERRSRRFWQSEVARAESDDEESSRDSALDACQANIDEGGRDEKDDVLVRFENHLRQRRRRRQILDSLWLSEALDGPPLFGLRWRPCAISRRRRRSLLGLFQGSANRSNSAASNSEDGSISRTHRHSSSRAVLRSSSRSTTETSGDVLVSHREDGAGGGRRGRRHRRRRRRTTSLTRLSSPAAGFPFEAAGGLEATGGTGTAAAGLGGALAAGGGGRAHRRGERRTASSQGANRPQRRATTGDIGATVSGIAAEARGLLLRAQMRGVLGRGLGAGTGTPAGATGAAARRLAAMAVRGLGSGGGGGGTGGDGRYSSLARVAFLSAGRWLALPPAEALRGWREEEASVAREDEDDDSDEDDEEEEEDLEDVMRALEEEEELGGGAEEEENRVEDEEDEADNTSETRLFFFALEPGSRYLELAENVACLHVVLAPVQQTECPCIDQELPAVEYAHVGVNRPRQRAAYCE
ncbi:hypothetical protein BESB_079380 [Besnoitia besnoiti]|uniref:CTLH/CRA C-terminal to LisH motif domain-containing protein n=1 Tax=Besnoitia besnoiti TaxID=94643 RepID=A0A2A9MEA7_BESBE|nr:hypothetical protein BESB_079380 [Besnoitia besnoiti]PFH33722.1 hypothetical protein BESB_079380 [Besnoitia besnoiti]